MKISTKILALMLSPIAAYAGAPNGSDIYQLTKINCASGVIDPAYAQQATEFTKNAAFLLDGRSHGDSVSYTDDLIVVVSKNRGNKGGTCDNDGKPTFEIAVFEKIN